MFPTAISNSTSLSGDASVSSGTKVQDLGGLSQGLSNVSPQQQPQKIKKKRSLPGNPGTLRYQFIIIIIEFFETCTMHIYQQGWCGRQRQRLIS